MHADLEENGGDSVGFGRVELGFEVEAGGCQGVYFYLDVAAGFDCFDAEKRRRDCG